MNRLLIAIAIILTLNLVTSSYILHIILPLAKALYLVLVLYIYGSIFMNFFGHKQNKDLETGQPTGFTSTVAVGLIFTTFFFYLVSLFKILSHWVLILFYLAPLFF
ncbi:MAG: hypothetical protein GTO20_34630, partial [Candidatus Aminicenantes bacterium]|nr:hypothetical protein [Candidatus Aminicenantes bacterium]